MKNLHRIRVIIRVRKDAQDDAALARDPHARIPQYLLIVTRFRHRCDMAQMQILCNWEARITCFASRKLFTHNSLPLLNFARFDVTPGFRVTR